MFLLNKFGVGADLAADGTWARHGRSLDSDPFSTTQVLVASGITRVVLVADAIDTRRAHHEFTQVGLEVTPAPTGLVAPWTLYHPLELLPDLGAFRGSYCALYEIIANIAGWVGLLGRT